MATQAMTNRMVRVPTTMSVVMSIHGYQDSGGNAEAALWALPFRPFASPEFRPRHRRDRRQPAARASASVQNQRSPLEGLIRVLS